MTSIIARPPDTTRHVDRLRRELYQLLATTNLPAPQGVVLIDGKTGPHGDLQMDNNRPQDVDRWAAEFGPGTTPAYSEVHDRRSGSAWRSYDTGHLRIAECRLRVWSAVDYLDADR